MKGAKAASPVFLSTHLVAHAPPGPSPTKYTHSRCAQWGKHGTHGCAPSESRYRGGPINEIRTGGTAKVTPDTIHACFPLPYMCYTSRPLHHTSSQIRVAFSTKK